MKQREHLIRSQAGIERHGAHAAGVQQAGELGDLGIARQQMLAVPMEPRHPDLPFHRAECGERWQGLADLPQRFHDRRVRRRVEARQAERRSDGAKGAFDSCGLCSHGVSA
ncbi:MAG: hypothetical protein DMD67_14010 [Gemmatimonadetes bacterium]|nr:MAG: hypothetical protein DMD67_14010 [Gemmatimonadota bacterium]